MMVNGGQILTISLPTSLHEIIQNEIDYRLLIKDEVVINMDWVIEELSSLSLGDKRVDRRAKKLVAQLSRNSTESIPTACGGAAETKAAYRFLFGR
jgi:hypothetical protein